MLPKLPSWSSSSSDSGASPCSSSSSLDSNRMRVFLFQTARGLFSSSGGYKANICLLRYLASQGHSVRQLCYSHRGEVESYMQTFARRSDHIPHFWKGLLRLRAEEDGTGTDVEVVKLTMDDGVQVIVLESESLDVAFGGKGSQAVAIEKANYIENGILSARLLDFVSFLQQEITAFSPTHIISNDGLSMQATSALSMPYINACRVGVIHTAEQLPFGPFAGGVPDHVSSPSEVELLQKLDGIWSVSKAIRQYALEYGQLRTDFFVHHPWTYLEETQHKMPVHLHNWDKRHIALINPCAVKGSQILIKLAKACPQYQFLVYKSWGFDDNLGKQMAALQNITVRPTCTDMEEAWRDIKVLLVPSLWLEAWGIVLIEAHIRGIPVISSNAGALPEAILGLDHLIPVKPIEGKRNDAGEYTVPEQNIEPWIQTVNKLMSDRLGYEDLSMKARTTTEQWLKNLDETALETWLLNLVPNLDQDRVSI